MSQITYTDHTLLLELFQSDFSELIDLPLYQNGVPAGFPSPSEEETELSLNLNTHLISHPSATFYAKVKGGSSEELEIYEGDLLIIDRTVQLRENDVAVCKTTYGFTIKRIYLPENSEPEDDGTSICTGEEQLEQICGVVTYVIHKF